MDDKTITISVRYFSHLPKMIQFGDGIKLVQTYGAVRITRPYEGDLQALFYPDSER